MLPTLLMGAITMLGSLAAQDPTLGQPRMPSAVSMTLYAQTGLEGPAIFIVEDVSNITASFRAESLRANRGVWEVCDRINFQGRCRTFEGNVLSINRDLGLRQIQSARPVSR